ncbi:MAG: hypothetical protein L0332_10655 [Chloroflexi bacterium]|nr:hypothetical protein [Chloroflexota bacterium]MCI0576127.1 hypothetical protein [Chloroflexota bacterium]MCI0647915.1 hypothetical protein [Chloroflexota bacterium]MCI0727166.1 hypothetical protein [Chloroflexota bacterium]
MTRLERAALLILLALLALLLFHSPGTVDVADFMLWMQNVETYNLRLGYALINEDYPPLTSAILLGVAQASRLFQIDPFIGFKLSLLLFLSLTGLAFYLWTRNFLITAALVAALILNSMGLAYVDVYFMPTFILALWALQKKNLLLATLLFSATCLVKWQPIIIAPFVLLYTLEIKQLSQWRQINFRRLLQQGVLPLAVLVGLLLAFFGAQPVKAFQAATHDPFLSGNALNFHWLVTYVYRAYYPHVFGGLVYDQVTFIASLEPHPVIQGARLIFYPIYLLVLWLFWRREKSFPNLVLFSLLGYLAYFLFNTGVHENHLILVCVPAAVLLWLDRQHLGTFLIWSLAANANLFVFYGVDGQGLPFNRVVGGIDLTVPLAIFNVLAFAALLVTAAKVTSPARDAAPVPNLSEAEPDRIPQPL